MRMTAILQKDEGFGLKQTHQHLTDENCNVASTVWGLEDSEMPKVVVPGLGKFGV